MRHVETWDRCPSVLLVETHRMICKMAYLGQSVTFALGDLRSVLPNDLGLKKTCESNGLDERNTGGKVIYLSYIAKKLLTKIYHIWKRCFLPDLEGRFLPDLNRQILHALGFGKSQAIHLYLLRSSITIRANGAGVALPRPQLRCGLGWRNRKCERGLRLGNDITFLYFYNLSQPLYIRVYNPHKV